MDRKILFPEKWLRDEINSLVFDFSVLPPSNGLPVAAVLSLDCLHSWHTLGGHVAAAITGSELSLSVVLELLP